MYDLRRIRYVTEHYQDLQGLTMLPLSLYFLAWAAYDLGWIVLPAWLPRGWQLLVASYVVVVALMWLIGKLYERAFGWIAPDAPRGYKPSKSEFWGILCLYMAGMWLATLRPEVSRLGLILAYFATLQGWLRRRSGYWLALVVLIAATSVAPLLDDVIGPIYPTVTAREVAIKLVTAIGLMVVGTLDHLALVRTLGPIRHEEESRA